MYLFESLIPIIKKRVRVDIMRKGGMYVLVAPFSEVEPGKFTFEGATM